MMWKHALVVAALAGLVFGGCSGLRNMGPDVTDAQRARIMALAKEKQFQRQEALSRSSADRIPLKAGQWVATLTTMKNGNRDVTLSVQKVVSVNGTTVVFETESWAASQDCVRNVSQVTLANYPLSAKLCYTEQEAGELLSNIQIVKMLSRHGDDPVQETPPQVLMLAQSTAKGFYQSYVRTGELEKKAVDTPYLKTSLAYVYDITVSVFGFSSTPKIYAHSKIPVSGQLKLEDENMLVETIAYGTSGAKSVL